MHRIVAAVLAASACASSLQAQTSPPTVVEPVLTLARALDLAGTRAPSRDAAMAGVHIAQAQRRVADVRPNPSIVVETENVAGTGSYREFRSSETTVGLALPLELGGKRGARVALADTRIDRAMLDREIAQADLRLRVTQAFTAVAAARCRLAIARDQLGIAHEGVRVASARVRAGRASPFEEQRAEVARIAAEGVAERAGRSAEVATGNLSRLIAVRVDAVDLDWFEQIPVAGGFEPARVPTLAAAAARVDIAAADAQVRLARSQRLPDLTVTASARRLEQTNDMAAVFGVSVPFQIFSRGRAAVAVSLAQREQVEALGRAALLDAAEAVAGAQADADNAATLARSATGPALAAAREAARIARIGYREGKFGQLDLLDAERTLAETRLAAIDALSALHDAEARLERLATPAPISTDTRS